MPTTLGALNVLIFLLPGFLSQRIAEGLIVTAKPSDLTRVIDALALSLVDYALYSILGIWLPLRPIPLTVAETGQLQVTRDTAFGFLALCGIAVLIAVIFAKSTNAGWHYWILREKLHLTHKTGRIDVWYDVFSGFQDNWIQITLKNGKKFYGWAEYFSENPERRELFLREVLVTEADGRQYEVRGSGVLVTERAEIESIALINPVKDQED